jgi:hypothetical protein
MTTPTQQIVQRGSFANDGTGDTLRDAAQKINDNFTYLWSEVWDSATTDNSAIITRLDGLDSDVLALTNRQDDLDSDLLALGGPVSNIIDGSPTGGASNDF